MSHNQYQFVFIIHYSREFQLREPCYRTRVIGGGPDYVWDMQVSIATRCHGVTRYFIP